MKWFRQYIKRRRRRKLIKKIVNSPLVVLPVKSFLRMFELFFVITAGLILSNYSHQGFVSFPGHNVPTNWVVMFFLALAVLFEIMRQEYDK